MTGLKCNEKHTLDNGGRHMTKTRIRSVAVILLVLLVIMVPVVRMQTKEIEPLVSVILLDVIFACYLEAIITMRIMRALDGMKRIFIPYVKLLRTILFILLIPCTAAVVMIWIDDISKIQIISVLPLMICAVYCTLYSAFGREYICIIGQYIRYKDIVSCEVTEEHDGVMESNTYIYKLKLKSGLRRKFVVYGNSLGEDILQELNERLGVSKTE